MGGREEGGQGQRGGGWGGSGGQEENLRNCLRAAVISDTVTKGEIYLGQ